MVCMGLTVGACCVQAQSTAAPVAAAAKTVPSYDVVSIKPDQTDTGRVSIHIDDGNFDALNVSLKTMILSAYSLKDAQLLACRNGATPRTSISRRRLFIPIRSSWRR